MTKKNSRISFQAYFTNCRLIFDLFKALLFDKVTFRFFFGVTLGLAFSISVILSTIGIMDGFDERLKNALKQASGDIVITPADGIDITSLENDIDSAFKDLKISSYCKYYFSQGILIFNEKTKGVAIKSVDPKTFGSVTGIKVDLNQDEIAIGKVLAQELGIKLFDNVVIALAEGNESINTLPELKTFKVQEFVDHGIYHKDARLIYFNRNVNFPDKKNNVVSLNISNNKNSKWVQAPIAKKYFEDIKEHVSLLRDYLGPYYNIQPFWNEYSGIIEAVEVEKVMIGLILQIVVVIAVFNVLAFVTFINEKKAREIFLVMALGMSKKRVNRFWNKLFFIVWILSCGLSILLTSLFNYLLNHMDIFKLPGDIYYLERLNISLDLYDYLLVFGGTYLWLFILGIIFKRKWQKKSIIYGLRRVFS